MTMHFPGRGEEMGHGSMTVEEAGRRGGERTAETHGREFFQEIGRKGGESVSQDREHMAEIGRKGGLKRSGRTE